MQMKKFINDPDNLTSELLEGYCKAHCDKVKLVSDKIVMRAEPKDESKVAIVTLGGAGHEPALSGFVGEGMLDASVVGDIFAAPGAPKVLEALKLLDREAGILFVVLNHEGDVMSGNMAMEMAQEEGINVRMILTHEDIAPGADAPAEEKRGLAGCIPLYKVAGAAAEAGKSLDEVYAVAEKMNNNMATLAVALKTATHPQSGDAIFSLADDEMEIGMGQHGEAGTGSTKLMTADETAVKMATQVLPAANCQSGDRILLMINGTGSTTLMEQYIVFRAAAKYAEDQGMTVAHALVGEYLTVQEMAGFQMFAAKLDDELVDFLKAPSDAPYWITR